MCFAIQSETQLGCHYQRLSLSAPLWSITPCFPSGPPSAWQVLCQPAWEVETPAFPEVWQQRDGKGQPPKGISLPKAQLAAHITGHLCALLTLAPLPQVPACFPRALLHLPQILLLQPGAAPRLPSSQHHSRSLGTAHSHTEQLGGVM